MPKAPANKMIPFDGQKLETALQLRRIGKLTLEKAGICSRRNLLHSIHEGRIAKGTLQKIADYLNVSPQLFTDSMTAYGYDELVQTVFRFYNMNIDAYRKSNAGKKYRFVKKLIISTQKVLVDEYPNDSIFVSKRDETVAENWGIIESDLEIFKECEEIRESLIRDGSSSYSKRELECMTDYDIYRLFILPPASPATARICSKTKTEDIPHNTARSRIVSDSGEKEALIRLTNQLHKAIDEMTQIDSDGYEEFSTIINSIVSALTKKRLDAGTCTTK